LLAELLGNKFLVVVLIPQQLKPMEVFGFGVMEVLEDLEQTILQAEVLQSLPLPEEITGSLFLPGEDIH